MSESRTSTAPAGILSGLCPRKETAAAFGVVERTVIRWEAAGLPVIKLGKQRLHKVESVRAWLLAREASAGSERVKLSVAARAGEGG